MTKSSKWLTAWDFNTKYVHHTAKTKAIVKKLARRMDRRVNKKALDMAKEM